MSFTMMRAIFVGVILFVEVPTALACGEGESWSESAGGTNYCCSLVSAVSWRFTVDGGSNDDNIQWYIGSVDDGTYWPTSLCDVSSSGTSCSGDGCSRSNNNDCSSSGTVNNPQRLCLYMACNNGWYDCNADSVSVTFYEYTANSPTPSTRTTPTPSQAESSYYEDSVVVQPSTVFYKHGITDVCGIDFKINSDEGVDTFLMEQSDFNVFEANSFTGAFSYIMGSRCGGTSEGEALRCSRSVTVDQEKTYVWLILNKDAEGFAWFTGDTATVQYTFTPKACGGLFSAAPAGASFSLNVIVAMISSAVALLMV